ncbi:MAG TPA: beta-propeller domain-containing protein [Candidatus Saccharimonadales bacterium]|nr:beta-propeller domain-containing protein [Candidatus Saccharimonadales bacterium]
MRKKIILLVSFFVIPLLLSGCSFPWTKNNPQPNPVVPAPESPKNDAGVFSGPQKFANYDEFEAFLKTHEANGNNYSYSSSSMVTESLSKSSSSGQTADFGLNNVNSGLSNALSDSSSQNSGASTSNQDFSNTNVQVAGVDEADIIKTDGQYIYAIVHNDLKIIKASPANELALVATLNFTSHPMDIYVDGNRLVVISDEPDLVIDQNNKELLNELAKRRNSEFTSLKIYDISSPAAPQELKNLSFDGRYSDSRLIDGHLFLILNNYFGYYSTDQGIVPILIDGGNLVSRDCSNSANCFAPEIYYFNDVDNADSLTSIDSIDIRGDVKISSAQSYLLGDSQTVYASLNNLYIAYPQNFDFSKWSVQLVRDIIFPQLSEDSKNKISKIEQADSDILTDYEKQEKVMGILQNFMESLSSEESDSLLKDFQEKATQKLLAEIDKLEQTNIQRFSLTGGEVKYQATGAVPGHVLNQFALNEDASGNLQIATTRNNYGNMVDIEGDSDINHSYSGMYILAPNLKRLGAVEKIAKDEKIYSVRFIGKRAYLVTFQQIDPLFVIDTENPSSPKLLGELKVPGYSTYLHPYDENTLIGFGRDVTVSSSGSVRNAGLKLSLFDVKDPTNPQELDSYIIGEAGSDSLALNNHKAFLFDHDKNLLAIPAYVREKDGSNFGGALVFSIDNNKFVLKGKVDHSNGGLTSQTDYWCGYDCYNNSVQRLLYIKDALYTFSNDYIKANDLETMAPIASLRLANNDEIDKRRVADVKQIQTALELYYNDEGKYPDSISSGHGIFSTAGNIYLAAVPTPLLSIDSCSNFTSYKYVQQKTVNGGTSYTLNYCLSSNTNGIPAGFQIATPSGIRLY